MKMIISRKVTEKIYSDKSKKVKVSYLINNKKVKTSPELELLFKKIKSMEESK